MNQYYIEGGKFSYIRYNSLPALADYILDHSVDYYKGWGVTVAHNKPIGWTKVEPYDTIFVNADLLDQCVDILANISVPYHLLTGNADRLLNDSNQQESRIRKAAPLSRELKQSWTRRDASVNK